MKPEDCENGKWYPYTPALKQEGGIDYSGSRFRVIDGKVEIEVKATYSQTMVSIEDIISRANEVLQNRKEE